MWLIRSAISSLSSYEWIDIFHRIGFKVCGTDIQFWGAPFISNFFLIPKATQENAHKVLGAYLGIVQRIRPTWIISGPEEEVILLSTIENKLLQEGTLLFHPPLETLEVITDKWRIYKELGDEFPIPKTWTPKEAQREKEQKIIIKPRKGRGSAGVKVAQNISEISLHTTNMDNFIIQPYLEGEEFSVDALYDMDGHLLNMVIRKRLRVDSGISVVTETVRHPKIIEIITELSRKLIFRGMMCFQFIETAPGTMWLIDLNPRFGGASIVSWHASSGLRHNLTALLLRNKESLKCNSISDYECVRLVRFYREVIIYP